MPTGFGARIGIAVVWYLGLLAALIMVIRARVRDTHGRLPERQRVSRKRMILSRSGLLPTRGQAPASEVRRTRNSVGVE
jgi:hypothetical protein